MVGKGSETKDICLLVQLLFLKFILTPAAHGFHSPHASSCGIGDNQAFDAKQCFIWTFGIVIRWNSVVDVISNFFTEFLLVILSAPIQFQDNIAPALFFLITCKCK